MDESTRALVWMSVAVLLPIAPSFVLFKWLSSSGEVGGPWHGLTVKIGGPAALYFAIFVSLLYVRPEETQHYHTWTVVGAIEFQHTPTEPPPNVNDVFVRFIPPRLGVMNQGMFTWQLPVLEDNGVLQFPDLQVDLRDYSGMTIPLGPTHGYGAQGISATYDYDKREIVISKPLTMQSVKTGTAYADAKGEVAQVIK